MKKLQAIDLFCGAGGLSYGFQKAGFTIVAGIDNDKNVLKTFTLNFPQSEAIEYNLTSVTEELTSKFNNIDVMLGGPPCQGFSIAGKRDENDPRNLLFESYFKLVKQINPRIVVIENVPNILSMGNGIFAHKITDGLKNLGYNVSISKLNSADFGVPQNRKRVFFIATKNLIYNIQKLEIFKIKNYITTEDALSDLPLLDKDLGLPLLEYPIKAQNDYQKLMRKNSSVLLNHEAVEHKEKTKEIIALVPDGGNYKDLPENLRKTRNVNIAWTRMNSKKPCFTIDAGHNHHFHYKANRVPTVRECARIQSFPDNFKFIGNRTSQYRQVGNAVPPILAEKIAQFLMCVIKEDL